MPDLYTDETVESVADIAMVAHYGDRSWLEEARTILDAVAPLIAAKALRDAATWMGGLFDPSADLFAGDMISMLERRANLIDPSKIVVGE